MGTLLCVRDHISQGAYGPSIRSRQAKTASEYRSTRPVQSPVSATKGEICSSGVAQIPASLSAETCGGIPEHCSGLHTRSCELTMLFHCRTVWRTRGDIDPGLSFISAAAHTAFYILTNGLIVSNSHKASIAPSTALNIGNQSLNSRMSRFMTSLIHICGRAFHGNLPQVTETDVVAAAW
jgi:hypothetical protein